MPDDTPTTDAPAIDLYEAMSTLRTVRRLRATPIPHEILERVLQAASWAPTGGNRQPWRVIAVQRRDIKERLGEIYREEWERFLLIFRERLAAMETDIRAKWERTVDAGNHLADNFADTPTVLMFCATPDLMTVTDADQPHPSFVAGGSIFTAVQNALLACRAEGLGCALTTLHCYRDDLVREILEIPDGWGTAAMIPIGYPQRRGHGPITRLPVAELAYSDTFGTPWQPTP
jgi:nitroreductase